MQKGVKGRLIKITYNKMKRYTLSKVVNPNTTDYRWKVVGEFKSWEEARDKALSFMELEEGEAYNHEPNGDIAEGFIGYKESKNWSFMIE